MRVKDEILGLVHSQCFSKRLEVLNDGCMAVWVNCETDEHDFALHFFELAVVQLLVCIVVWIPFLSAAFSMGSLFPNAVVTHLFL